jgi:hypothetical protein
MELLLNLKAAQEHAANCKINHVELRIKYLSNLAEAIISRRCPILDTPRFIHEKAERVAHEIRKLIKRECRRRMCRQIGGIMQPNTQNRGGLSMVYIPTSPKGPFPDGPDPKHWKGDWSTLTQPEDIALHVCAANARQYNQAATTPFTSEPLSGYFGTASDTPGAMSFLQGELPPESVLSQLQPETIQLLERTVGKGDSPSNPINTTISQEAFISCYNSIKEYTSSSPSRRHVGHYKAATKSDLLSTIYSKMMSIPFSAGFSPKRWHKVKDIMLEKEIGCPYVHRLCILALLESDFNQAV